MNVYNTWVSWNSWNIISSSGCQGDGRESDGGRWADVLPAGHPPHRHGDDEEVQHREGHRLQHLSGLCSLMQIYRVCHLLVNPGWVDFEFGVPPSWPAVQPQKAQAELDRQLELSKIKSTQPSPRAHGSPCSAYLSIRNPVRKVFKQSAQRNYAIIWSNPLNRTTWRSATALWCWTLSRRPGRTFTSARSSSGEPTWNR